MLERIIEIADAPAHLKIDNHLLVIESEDGARHTVPPEEVGVLLLSNPRMGLSAAVLSQLTAAGAAVVCCDDKFLPSGMFLPLQSHCAQTGRLRAQLAAAKPVNKKIWQDIVAAKIASQGKLLRRLLDEDRHLSELAREVKSDDSTNLEGRAARIYWDALALFETRDREADDANIFLNYGYAVLHSCCARAVCSVGLHPSIGVHHCNQYNAFVLASDLMEPYRVLIDRAVYEHLRQFDATALTKMHKSILIRAVIDGRVKIKGKWETVFNALLITAESLANIYLKKSKTIALPTEIGYES